MRLLEGLAALTVQQGHLGRLPHVFHIHFGAPSIGGDSAGGLVHHDVAAQAVHLVLGANVGNQPQDVFAHRHLGQQFPAAEQPLPFLPLLFQPAGHKGMGVCLVGDAAAHHFPPFLRGHYTVHFHGQPEAVQELGTEVALFRVHRPYQDKLGGMAYRNALPLHVVASHSRGVQQHVNQVIIEQIYLVNVEDAPVSGGNQARLKALAAGLDGLLNVQGTDQPVFAGAHRQVNDTHLVADRRIIVGARFAPLAQTLPRLRGATIGAALKHGYLGQQGGKRTDGGGLGRAFLAPDKNTANLGIDGVEKQRPLHRGLPDNGGKGEGRLLARLGQVIRLRSW